MFIIASVRCSVIDTIIPSGRMFVTAVLSQMLLWAGVLVVSHRQVFLMARCRVTAVLCVKESYSRVETRSKTIERDPTHLCNRPYEPLAHSLLPLRSRLGLGPLIYYNNVFPLLLRLLLLLLLPLRLLRYCCYCYCY